MSLKEVTHIEGYEGIMDFEEYVDTNPTVPQISFHLESVERTFKSNDEGKIVRENEVWVKQIVNLGNLINFFPIKDKVEFNKTTNKWVVKKLAPIAESYILRYPKEWNQFALSMKDQVIGTPLSLLFKVDPAKVDYYKAKFVTTIEQLAAFGTSEFEQVGPEAKEDSRKAKNYLSRVEALAPGIAADNLIAERDKKIDGLLEANENQAGVIADLTAKLQELLQAEVGVRSTASRAKPRTKPAGKPRAKPRTKPAGKPRAKPRTSAQPSA